MTYWYEVETEVIEPGEMPLIITCPALPEVITYGATRRKAFRQAGKAIEAALATRIADRAPIPAPNTGRAGDRSSVDLPPAVYIKITLYRMMMEQDVTPAELAERLEIKKHMAEQLIHFHHNTQLSQLSDAIWALGGALNIDVRMRFGPVRNPEATKSKPTP